MALIRDIFKHPQTEQWAYVEYSDENPRHLIILGNKEFNTYEEAKEFSKGFAPGRYQWNDRKLKNINDLKTSIEVSQVAIDRWQLLIRELENKIHSLRLKIKLHQDDIIACNAKIDELEGGIDDWLRRISEMKNKIASQES